MFTCANTTADPPSPTSESGDAVTGEGSVNPHPIARTFLRNAHRLFFSLSRNRRALGCQ